LGRFYAEVFDADVGPTRTHGTDGKETMTIIRIGSHTELNIFVIEGNTEPERHPWACCVELDHGHPWPAEIRRCQKTGQSTRPQTLQKDSQAASSRSGAG
jgi:hypothetical protein